MLEISPWTMLQGQIDEWKLTAIQLRCDLRTINATPGGGHLTYSKYPNQALKTHLHQLDYVNQFDIWVPQKLNKQTKKHLLDCISACDYSLKCNENVPFLKQMRRGDEK